MTKFLTNIEKSQTPCGRPQITVIMSCLIRLKHRPLPVADPDLELRGGGGGGLDLLAMPAIFPSVISSFFTQNKGGGPGPPGPPGPSPRSATA